MTEPTTTPIEDDDIVTQADELKETSEDAVPDVEASETEAAPDLPPPPVADPAPDPQVVEVRRGPGFFPLVLGGVIAAGIGYGATYLGYLPVGQAGDDDALAGFVEQLDGQTTALIALADRTGAFETQLANLPEPPAAPEPVDLAPLSAQIDGLGTQIAANGATLQGLTDRVAYLETLPLGDGGDGDGDNGVAVAAAVAQLRAALQEQTASLAAQQAENTALGTELRSIATAAEESIAAAEARASARVDSATAQAALGQLRIAVATGAPFTSALADVVAATEVEVPADLQAIAETGAPTLDSLQASFPAAARAALPVAIRETAGDGAMDRVTAFLQSQVGGRSLEPQEGDGADAVLSRADAAMRSGDVDTALTEIATLPDAAQEVLADWVSAASARMAATDALAQLAAALDSAN